jgi:hypothetical protein
MDASVHVLATVYDDANSHGSSYGDGVPVSVLELDAGYKGTVVFETRWYGTADSYADYVSSFVTVTVRN